MRAGLTLKRLKIQDLDSSPTATDMEATHTTTEAAESTLEALCTKLHVNSSDFVWNEASNISVFFHRGPFKRLVGDAALAGAHPTGCSCTAERRLRLCYTCQRLPPPCTVMKMIPSTPSPLVHTSFRLQRVRGWLTSSMYLVVTVCVDMCGGSFDVKSIQLS